MDVAVERTGGAQDAPAEGSAGQRLPRGLGNLVGVDLGEVESEDRGERLGGGRGFLTADDVESVALHRTRGVSDRLGQRRQSGHLAIEAHERDVGEMFVGIAAPGDHEALGGRGEGGVGERLGQVGDLGPLAIIQAIHGGMELLRPTLPRKRVREVRAAGGEHDGVAVGIPDGGGGHAGEPRDIGHRRHRGDGGFDADIGGVGDGGKNGGSGDQGEQDDAEEAG